MYKSLLTEAFLMESIISALITGVVTIIGAVIVYQVKLTKIFDNTVSLKETLKEKSEKGIEGQSHLSKEHSEIIHNSKTTTSLCGDIRGTLYSLDTSMKTEQAKQEMRYENLTEKQKDMSSSVRAIEAMHSELLRLQTENMELRQKLREKEMCRPDDRVPTR